jgi:hypothetical protein
MASPRKSRKKAQKLQVEHKVYGSCLLVERRATPTGNDILLVQSADKSTRSLLASPEFWVNLPDLDAIPVTQAAVPVEPEEEIEKPVSDDDVEPELQIGPA